MGLILSELKTFRFQLSFVSVRLLEHLVLYVQAAFQRAPATSLLCQQTLDHVD